MNYSKQRDAIYNYLKNVKTHPTAEMIYNELRIENPELSLGTVYRNLDRLSKSHDILRLKGFGGKDRFDGNTDHHYHAKCIKCGKIIDIFLNYFSNIDNEASCTIKCEVLSHDLIFDIICQECK